MAGQNKRSVLELKELIHKFSIENSEGCWLWTKPVDRDGYGQQTWGPKNWRIHRLAYHIYIGEVADHLVVRHLCGNRRCCNPLHLSSGTHKQNTYDMVLHGRSRLHNESQEGSSNHMANFTEDQVYAIRCEFLSEKISSEELGAKYGASRRCIERTIRGEAYGCYDKISGFYWYELPKYTFRKKLTRMGVDKVNQMLDEDFSLLEISEYLNLPPHKISKIKKKRISNVK